ncbi:MAG: hypothetical protein ACRCXZ_00145 [Patescibacteria group bacterium]
MSFLPISSLIMADPNFRFALMYNALDKKICEIIHTQFGQANVRFQIKIVGQKINISFWYLDKYYLTYFKSNEEQILIELREEIKKFQTNRYKPFKIFFNFYGQN